MLKKYVYFTYFLIILFGGCFPDVKAQRIGMLDIAGPTDSFIQRFDAQLGFKRIADENKRVVMRGILNGETADLILYETPLTHRVYKVHVRFKAFKKWKDAKAYYHEKLSSLEKKYGNVVNSDTLFKKPYCDGAGKEFKALKEGKGKFQKDWGMMPYNQNLFLQYWIDSDQHVYLSFTLRDEWMKFQEEEKLTQNSLF